MLNKILVIVCILNLMGCQTTSLSEPDGTGAALITLDIDIDGKAKFPCGSIGLKFNDEWNRFYFTTESSDNSLNGYSLITGLEPGAYQFTEFRCYAGNKRIFNGSKRYLTKSMHVMDLSISANTVTRSQVGVVGMSKYLADMSTFQVDIGLINSDVREEVERRFFENPLPEGWSIK